MREIKTEAGDTFNVEPISGSLNPEVPNGMLWLEMHDAENGNGAMFLVSVAEADSIVQAIKDARRDVRKAAWLGAKPIAQIEQKDASIATPEAKLVAADLLYIAVRSYGMAQDAGRWVDVERAMGDYRDA